MGHLRDQTRAGLRQLPWMLGKLLGALAAAIGFTTAIFITTRHGDATWAGTWPPLLAGAAGIAVFILADRALARRAPDRAGPGRTGRLRSSALAWALLLLIAGLLLAGVHLYTG